MLPKFKLFLVFVWGSEQEGSIASSRLHCKLGTLSYLSGPIRLTLFRGKGEIWGQIQQCQGYSWLWVQGPSQCCSGDDVMAGLNPGKSHVGQGF